MTPTIAKAIYVLLNVAWYVIRLPHERRSRRTPVARSARSYRELALILIALTGLGILPFVYIATGFPSVADYPFRPLQAWLGALVTIIALAMFYLTHQALGRNWSVSLDVRKNHELITGGIYHYVRHPMYTAFWLWALAQALLLPNWVAGLSGIVGFGTLYFFRVGQEERMMLEAFGESYRSYMARTKRLIPWIY
jgi:protein-S-isoprenylcysteine O-methyltransferase Ste14